MNKFRRSIFGITFILLATLATAKEIKSDELNYTITVPDGWTVDFQNSVGFTIYSPGKHNRTITLLTARQGARNFPTGLDSTSLAEYEQGLQKAGSTKISSKNFIIDGIPAYETVQQIGKTPYETVFIYHLIIADNKLYFLSGSFGGGDATTDSEIQEGLASFHFLQPPKPPSTTRFGSLGEKLAIFGIIVVGIVFWMIQRQKT